MGLVCVCVCVCERVLFCVTNVVDVCFLLQGDKCREELPERGPGMLWGGGGADTLNRRMLHPQQNPHGQEEIFSAQRRGP